MRKYLAEFIGTAMLVLFGCGSAVAANALMSAMGMGLPVAFTTLLISFAFGLTMVAMYYSIGNISGAHINPAVSLGMLISGKLSIKDFIGYVVAQLIGGIAGAGLLAIIIKGRTSLGANGYGDSSTFGISMWTAFLIEVILTFVFVITVIGATDKTEYKGAAGIVIGFALTLVHIFGVPFTGTSVNPARALGPALLQGGTALTQVWVFIAAPLVGGALAAIVYKLLMMKPREKAPKVELDSAEASVKIEEPAADLDTSTR